MHILGQLDGGVAQRVLELRQAPSPSIRPIERCLYASFMPANASKCGHPSERKQVWSSARVLSINCWPMLLSKLRALSIASTAEMCKTFSSFAPSAIQTLQFQGNWMHQEHGTREESWTPSNCPLALPPAPAMLMQHDRGRAPLRCAGTQPTNAEVQTSRIDPGKGHLAKGPISGG